MGNPTGTVTFLFTDIQGSTKLAREYPERWERARARHHAILREAIECHQGYVFQIIGDAFCAAFHTAGDALRAARKSQITLCTEPWDNMPIKVRMGIHTGKAEMQENGEYHGYLAMSRVQRLMSAGHGGQVLISAASQELLLEDLPEDISLRDLGERRLKDLIRPEHIYQLVIPSLPVDFPPLKTLDFYRHNLPVQLTSFIGRQKEISEIRAAILTHHLVTLTGVGGTGKTRLALQIAADVLDHFPDGVWFVDLAPITDSGLIPQTILTVLGIPDQAGQTQQQQLLDVLHKQKLLILMDNCEHLIEACAHLVSSLLNHEIELRILTTSREALGVPGEMIWQVPSLSLPDVEHLPDIEQLSQYEAVQLFIERTVLVQPHFQVTNATAPAVAQICFRLDGIPLAIELAAARVRTMSIEQIATRLDDRFRLLTGGSRTTLERHQTLRAAVDWSYNLLSDAEKILFRSLSVFVGGWTLEAAEQVCAEGSDVASNDVFDLLSHLVDKSLVILVQSRYRMLETIQQFARERVLASAEDETLREKHLAYFVKFAEHAAHQSSGMNDIQWRKRLIPDDDNFRAALERCLSQQNTRDGLRLLVSWKPAAGLRFNETLNWFERIRSLPDCLDHPALYAELLNHIGVESWLRGKDQDGRAVLEESLPIWQKLGTAGERGLAVACLGLGEILLSSEEEINAAQSFFERSFELYQRLGDKGGMNRAMYGLGHKAMAEGNYEDAEVKMSKCLEISKELGDHFGVAGAMCELGTVAQLQDDYERAYNFYEQGIKMFREMHISGIVLPISLYNSAWVLIHQGDSPSAKMRLEESLALFKDDGDTSGILLCLAGLAGILGMSSKAKEAARLFGAVENLYARCGARPMDESDRKEVTYFVERIHQQLDEATFATQWADGRTMTLEQAMAFALKETSDF